MGGIFNALFLALLGLFGLAALRTAAAVRGAAGLALAALLGALFGLFGLARGLGSVLLAPGPGLTLFLGLAWFFGLAVLARLLVGGGLGVLALAAATAALALADRHLGGGLARGGLALGGLDGVEAGFRLRGCLGLFLRTLRRGPILEQLGQGLARLGPPAGYGRYLVGGVGSPA